jgi:hypothetical protein
LGAQSVLLFLFLFLFRKADSMHTRHLMLPREKGHAWTFFLIQV